MKRTLSVWYALVIFVGAGILSGACDSDPGDNLSPWRVDCVEKINEFRATEGLPPLDRWKSGESCADDEARQDAASGMAHGAFPQCEESAQNECPGWSSLDDIIDGCLQMMWDEGPGEPYSEHGHYINMSNTAYTEVACGFHTTDSDAVWAIQNFR